MTYIDPYYSRTQRKYPVSDVVTVNTGATGTIAIITESGEPLAQFQVGDTIYMQVQDADLRLGRNRLYPLEGEGLGDAIEAALAVPETKEIETVKLTYQPDGNRYLGSIVTAYSETPQPDDGVLQTVGMQVVGAFYLDGIQATGQTNVLVHAETRVKIGDTARLDFSFRPAEFSAKPEPSSVEGGEGLPALDNRKFFKAGDALVVRLRDTDLNQNENLQETVDVTLSGAVLNDQLKLMVKETADNSGEFTGICPTRYATRADAANDVLEVAGKAVVTLSYIDALQGSGETDVVVTDEAHVRSGVDGVVEIVKSNYVTHLENFNAGDTLYFRLHDEDIFDDAVDITLIGDSLNDQEIVQLFPTPIGIDARGYAAAGTFFGSIETVYSTEGTEYDGSLQVQGMERIRAIYIDGLRSSGETDVEVPDVCVANVGTTGSLKVYNKKDSAPNLADNLEISRFRAGDTLILEIRDADLSTTNAVAQLFETDFIENTERDNIRVTMVEVTGSAGIFRGEVKTSYGEVPIPDDNILQVQGEGIVTFTYSDALQDTGATQVPIRVELSVETGDTGKLEIYSEESGKRISGFSLAGSFNAGEKLRIQLRDKDLDLSPTQIDTSLVTASGNVIADEVQISLRETAVDSGIFEGTLETQPGAQNDPAGLPFPESVGTGGDDVLQVTDKEVISAVYTDEVTAIGDTNVRMQVQAVVLSSSAGVLRIVDENAVASDLVADHELGSFNAGQTIFFWLENLLLSTVVGADEVKITVAGNKTNDEVDVILRKNLDAEGVFIASIPTRYGTTPVADGTLDVQGDEEIRAVYIPEFLSVNTVAVEDHAYVNKGVRGRLMITRQDGTIVRYFNPGSPLLFRLEDADLNLDPFVVESTSIQVKTDSQETATVVTLYEENANSPIFKGSILTQYGRTPLLAPRPSEVHGRTNNGMSHTLGLVGGEVVTAIYEDGLIDTGGTNVEISTSCRANLIAWAPYTRNPMVIDGLDDKWPLEKVLRTPQDEALLWLQWGKDSLYVLAQIYDDAVVVPDATKYYEDADALEVHFDLQPEGGGKPIYLRTGSDPNRYILWICPKGAGFNGDQPYIGQWTPERIYNYEAKNLEIDVRQESN